jgi:ureidoglycolate hydrolase
MDEGLLEVKMYGGEGYCPLIDFSTWRVAILRWESSVQPEKFTFMERHTQTDEVFVLLNGQATLVLGGNSSSVDGVHPQKMKTGYLYNVKQNAWHTVMLSQDASILIVEENNTGSENTEYCELADNFRKEIATMAMRLETKRSSRQFMIDE